MSHAQDPSYVLGNAGTFLALCPIFAGLRIYTRASQGLLRIDDWIIIPATLLTIGCAITLIIGVDERIFGYPTPPFPQGQNPLTAMSKNFTVGSQLTWAFYLMHIVQVGLVKLSFVFFFRHIFHTGHSRAFNIATILMATLVAMWTIAIFLWQMFDCRASFTGRWHNLGTDMADCPSDGLNSYALGISDFILDGLIFILPIPMVLNMHITTKRKLLIFAAFSFGAVALAASATRLALFVYLIRVQNGEISDPSIDPNLVTTKGLYWSMLESGLGLIAACLPAMNQFFRLSSVQTLMRSAFSMRSLSSHEGHNASHASKRTPHSATAHPSAESMRDLNARDGKMSSTDSRKLSV